MSFVDSFENLCFIIINASIQKLVINLDQTLQLRGTVIVDVGVSLQFLNLMKHIIEIISDFFDVTIQRLV